MIRERTGAIIIGAGVVGLACARAIASQGIETIILERHDGIGQETSSRNSEVIHAGLYYPGGSLKARLCVSGRRQLYSYCETHGIPHRRCGKLIVATNEAQTLKLPQLQAQAAANGVNDIRALSAAEAHELEPALSCTAALFSPSTGIIDSHAFMLSLQGEAERHGAVLATNASVTRGRLGELIELTVLCGNEEMVLEAPVVINAAGLHSVELARQLEGFPQAGLPRAHFAKGNYYSLGGKSPFSHLIYPVPEEGGLGVHLTLDLAGDARFGPDVEWIQSFDYSVDPRRCNSFYAEVRKYWPNLPDNSLSPAYCGIRPKISGPGQASADFMIQGPTEHGVRGLVNLFGIESPGLTASLAIASHVKDLVSSD